MNVTDHAPAPEMIQVQKPPDGLHKIGLLIEVRLSVWGFTRADAQDAHMAAHRTIDASGLSVVAENVQVGPPCTILTIDLTAVAQDADYEWKWVAHRMVGER